MKLREAEAQDIDTVVDLITAMLHEMASHGGHPLREESRIRSLLRARFSDGLEKADHISLLALVQEGENKPAGMVEVSVVSPHGIFRGQSVVRVHSLYVQPRWRRRGIGRRLLEAAQAWGRKKRLRGGRVERVGGKPSPRVV